MVGDMASNIYNLGIVVSRVAEVKRILARDIPG